MKIEIKHWISGSILFEGDFSSLSAALVEAVKGKKNLSGAYLSGADLRGADLRGADLRGAYLSDAYLSGADLRGADLRGAYLRGADLRGAYLRGAYLRGADLSGADLRGAYLSGADLSGADLRDVPKIENIDSKILAAIESGGSLNMGDWHACETTHCRAGWAIHLAGKLGYDLEAKVGSHVAGILIYRESRPAMKVPDFFASNADALADIKKCATAEAKLTALTTPAAAGEK